MRRALPLVLLALVAVGCGERTYSESDAVTALGGASVEVIAYSEGGSPPFATLAAVTELRIDSGPVLPLQVYGGDDVRIARYRSAQDARMGGSLPLVFIVVGNGKPPSFVEVRRGNLVFAGRQRQVDAA